MRVLLVKLSSMGDLVQVLPALTDAKLAIPGIQFDWVADEAFAQIPLLHPAVNRIIKTAHRRWVKAKWQALKSGELGEFWRELRLEKYDLVLDAQSNLKSALVTRLARGLRCGMDKNSVREKGAQLAYQKKIAIPDILSLHGITRMRLLFAKALGYELPNTAFDHGIDTHQFPQLTIHLPKNYLVFLHSTTWSSKYWPERYWVELVKLSTQAGYNIVLPWGNAKEQERSERLALIAPTATFVLPRLKILEQATIMLGAQCTVGLDTGLAHLVAALPVKSLHLYGPTNPKLLGVFTGYQKYLTPVYPCQPCYLRKCKFGDEAECFVNELPPQKVWKELAAHLCSL